ncbi:MAG: hypothetical protein HY080_02505 [Gammaproteobacteria bacterium]|nr:hypothetical protein [Gammaproteobacteria bacterium]
MNKKLIFSVITLSFLGSVAGTILGNVIHNWLYPALRSEWRVFLHEITSVDVLFTGTLFSWLFYLPFVAVFFFILIRLLQLDAKNDFSRFLVIAFLQTFLVMVFNQSDIIAFALATAFSTLIHGVPRLFLNALTSFVVIFAIFSIAGYKIKKSCVSDIG